MTFYIVKNEIINEDNRINSMSLFKYEVNHSDIIEKNDKANVPRNFYHIHYGLFVKNISPMCFC